MRLKEVENISKLVSYLHDDIQFFSVRKQSCHLLLFFKNLYLYKDIIKRKLVECNLYLTINQTNNYNSRQNDSIYVE